MRAAIVAIVKSEAPYLLEWVAFHRVVGIRSFLIANNGGDDGTSELLELMARAGYVFHFDFVGRSGVQREAYDTVIPHVRNFAELAVIIDADEFIRPLGAGRVDTALSGMFADPSVSAVGINWAIYGSSGRIKSGRDLVTKRFSARAKQDFGVNNHVKTAVRVDRFVSCENSHFMRTSDGRYVHTNGEDVEWHPKYGVGVALRCHWQGVRLDHFVVKSRDEFNNIKLPRGDVGLPNDHPKFLRDSQFFPRHDRNEVHDPMPSWLIWMTRLEIMRMRSRLFRKKHGLFTK
jgi:hypothetical protein